MVVGMPVEPVLRIPRFQREGRTDHKVRNDLVIGKRDVIEAPVLEDGCGLREMAHWF
jgi:hypothetical protein